MQSIETTGKNLNEAQKAAVAQLGVALEGLNITVIEETKGLFGKSTVRIRAEVIEAPKAVAPVEAPVEAAPAPKTAAKATTAKKGLFGKEPAAEKPKPTAKKAATTKKATEPVVEAVVEQVVAEDATEPVGTTATEADGTALAEYVRFILEPTEMDVSANATGISGRYVNIEMDGKDAAYLVGKSGEVLNALQYLVNIGMRKESQPGIRVTLECNSYRQRREETLTVLATKIATEVKARGEEAVLDALPAFERRIVHKALSEIDGVTTYSEGEEPNRRVVIAPAT